MYQGQFTSESGSSAIADVSTDDSKEQATKPIVNPTMAPAKSKTAVSKSEANASKALATKPDVNLTTTSAMSKTAVSKSRAIVKHSKPGKIAKNVAEKVVRKKQAKKLAWKQQQILQKKERLLAKEKPKLQSS